MDTRKDKAKHQKHKPKKTQCTTAKQPICVPTTLRDMQTRKTIRVVPVPLEQSNKKTQQTLLVLLLVAGLRSGFLPSPSVPGERGDRRGAPELFFITRNDAHTQTHQARKSVLSHKWRGSTMSLNSVAQCTPLLRSGLHDQSDSMLSQN
jgi:hypothetical protein